MRRGWFLAALLLLGACDGIDSREPLIAESQPPAQIAGHYQIYTPAGLDAADSTRDIDCLTVANEGLPRSYCHFGRKEDRGDVPRFVDIEPRGDGLVFRDPEWKSYSGRPDATVIRFLPLADAIYLVQMQDEDAEHFGYVVTRVTDGGLELFNPGCDYFRNSTERVTRQYGVTCTARSLAAIRPELDAFVARIRGVEIDPFPMAYLKRR